MTSAVVTCSRFLSGLAAWLLAVLVGAYSHWVTPIANLGGLEERTSPRIVLGVVFVSAAGLAHLLQLAVTTALSPDVRPAAAEPHEPAVSAAKPRAG